MIHSKILWSIVILSAIFIQGCRIPPQYETFYSFVPPKEAEGKSCIFQCSMTESQCDQLSQMRLDTCEAGRSNQLQACESRAQAALDACIVKNGVKNCFIDTCFESKECASKSNCKTQYNNCYSTCGGVVSSETRCVANCDASAARPESSSPQKR